MPNKNYNRKVVLGFLRVIQLGIFKRSVTDVIKLFLHCKTINTFQHDVTQFQES